MTSKTSPAVTTNSDGSPTFHETDYILVEIVSALNVPNVDYSKEPDPFVVVEIGGKLIHQTDVLYDQEFPIWSLECGSLFLVDATSKDKYVHFILKEYETWRRDPTLGTVDVSIEEMRNGKGDRLEFPMIVPEHVADLTKSVKTAIVRKTRLVLRFKPATHKDVEFIKNLQKNKAGIFSNETYLPTVASLHQQLAAKSLGVMPPFEDWGRNSLFGAASTKRSANQPPDPMMVEAMKPSQEWIKVGDPDAKGKVYVEVLACNDLPNLDLPTILNLNNLTDAFCCLIMEDNVVNTSYIRNNLNPRWMPSGDNRAFVFGVQHPSSHLYVGIFNHNSTDSIYKPFNVFQEWVHTPVGRVLINLTQLHPDTLYTLHYNIYEVSDESAKDRMAEKHNGTLIIRLRIEWDQQILAAMKLPPPYFISVPRKHDFQTATYTTVGERGTDAFSLGNLTSYLEELQTYIDGEKVELIAKAALTVFFWRGTHKMTLFGREFKMPIHSMVAFTWGLLVTENYNRFPSFAVFAIAWFLLASMDLHLSHPSPWFQCESYTELLLALLAEISNLIPGTSFCAFRERQKETIIENENIDQIRLYNETIRRRKEIQKEVDMQQAAALEEEVRQHEAEMVVLSEASVATAMRETENFFKSLNPLKPILHPIQAILHQICIYLRVITSIVKWQENYYPFWIVTSCLVLSGIIFFIPWGLVLRMVFRILVWVLLGPWMRVVDWYYFEQIDFANMTQEEKEHFCRKHALARHKALQANLLQSRTQREEMVKQKSMMKYMFGKYVVRVPRFQQAQFLDYPLPASTAVPYEQTGGDVTTIGHVCSQSLVGDMVPSRMVQMQPFVRKIGHDIPSERHTARFSTGAGSPLAKLREKAVPQEKSRQKRKRLSFSKLLFQKKIK